MILTGPEIESAKVSGVVTIDPFSKAQLNPNSYNVRLGSRLLRYEADELDAARENPVETINIDSSGFVLQPHELYLGHTVEKVGSTEHVPLLFGRSSVGRLGLFVEITAPIGDIGFVGQWTLMLTPVVPLRVYPGMEIGQIMFFESVGEVLLYQGKYQGSAGPRASQLWRSRIEATGASDEGAA